MYQLKLTQLIKILFQNFFFALLLTVYVSGVNVGIDFFFH